jgi:hypothetical protein
VKPSFHEVVEAYRIVRRRGSYILLGSRLTDGGGVVSLTRQSAARYPPEDSWYSFLLEAESIQGHSAAGRIRQIKK